VSGARSWLRRHLLEPMLNQLRQGMSPEKIALTIALGLSLSVFPILGSTTLLCLLAGIAFKLNQPLIQIANYLGYPLQILLLLPFYRAGEWLGTPHLALSVPDLVERFKAGPWQFMLDFGLIALGGVGIWCLCAPLFVGLVYGVLLVPLRLLGRRVTAARSAPV
jgi:uncharacterized protein (DUF2062 family)